MERGVITEIPLYVLQMFSSPSPIISRLIGVTSHTTPLSIRRGAGGEAAVFSVCRRPSVGSKRWLKSSVKSVCSVRENPPHEFCICVLCERKRRYVAVSISGSWWHRLFSTYMKNIYKEWWDRLLFTMEILARWKNITHMISESYEYETRKGLSCTMKGLSLYQEGRVLEHWRASFTTLNGLPYI